MARQRSTPHSFDDRLRKHRQLLEEKYGATSEAEEKARIKRQLRQIDTAVNMNRWLASANLKSPT